MKQRWNVVAVVAVIMLVALAPLAAQNYNPTSNTNASTAGLFSNEVDKIVSPTNYSSVVAGKSLAFTKIGETTTLADGSTPPALDLGYATKLGDIYLGTYYRGALLQGGSSTTDTVTTNYEVSNGQLVDSTKTTVSTVYSDPGFFTNNEINVLVGLAGHGIKVGFYENLVAKETAGSLTTSSVTTDKDSKNVTSAVYSDRTNLVGNIKPSIGWGSNFTLGNLTLSPEAQIVADFYQNKQAYTLTKSVKKSDSVVYSTAGGTEDNGKTTYVSEGGYIQPSATVSAKLKFPKVDGDQVAVKLAYNFKTNIYGSAAGTTATTNKEYVTRDASFNTTTVTSKSVTTNKVSTMTNTITPQVTYTKDLDEAISVGVDFKAPIAIVTGSTSSGNTQVDTTTKYVSSSQDRSQDTTTVTSVTTPASTIATSSLTVTPTLNAGVQYKVIPGRLTLNGGLKITAPSFTNSVSTTTPATTNKTTKKVTDGNGVVTTDSVSSSNVDDSDPTTAGVQNFTDTRTISNTWGSLSQSIVFGGVFNFTDKFALDMKSGITGQTLSIMGAGDGILTTSMSLAFIIKN